MKDYASFEKSFSVNDIKNVFLKIGIVGYLNHLPDLHPCHLSFCSCDFRSRVMKIHFLYVSDRAEMFILVKAYSFCCGHISQKKNV